MQVALRYEFLESYWLLKGKFMEDRMIVERCLNGDTDSFEYLVTKYKKLVYSIALRFFNDPHLAEDVTQEVFFKAYRKLYMYDTNMKFSAWISRIAHNTCIDTLRKNKTIRFPQKKIRLWRIRRRQLMRYWSERKKTLAGRADKGA